MRLQKKASKWRVAFDCLERRQLLALVLTAETISAPQQSSFSGVVATLIDTNLNDSPSDFNKAPGSVQVDWGDGQTSAGLVVGAILPGVFKVDATHVYAQAGSYSTQITVTSQSGQDAIANGSAIVTTEPQQLTIVGNTIAGTAGQPLTNVTVATFLDSDPTDTASDFTALITWGNGNASIGTIQGGNGAFTVTGTNTYKAAGTYATNITVIGLNNGQSGFATGQAKIGPSSPYTIIGQQFIETAGASFTVPVATFTDPNVNDPSSNFTASINWGNGQSSEGTVTGSNGSFTVSGSYLYPLPGTYSVIVTLVDKSNQTVVTTSTATVTGPVLTPVSTTITPSVGQPFTGVVASVLDTNASDTSNNLSATITWGNGNVTTGTVVPVPGTPGLFDVKGTNTYTAAGTIPVSVVIVNTDGQSVTALSTAIVAAPTIIATGTTFPVTPGQQVNTTVATFTDSNTAATFKNLTATINWGDGGTTQGMVNATGTSGLFTVTGTYAYINTGAAKSFPVVVTITDPSGQTATANSTADVVSPVITPIGTTITPAVGQPLPSDTIVASFLDETDTASTLSATITWGDGHVTKGTVMPEPNTNRFDILGSNTYTTAGTYAISVLLVNTTGQSATANSTAIVAASTIVAAGTNFLITPGQSLGNTVVATFADTNPAALNDPSLISAVINWGNGDTSPGIVNLVSSSGTIGTFTVTAGSYTYPTSDPSGTFSVTVTILDPSGQSATANSVAYVVSTITNGIPFNLSGGLAQAPGNGPYTSKGYTNTNQPTFSGTATPFSIVQLYARPFGIDTQIPLGEAVTNGSGQWSLTAGPLLPGTYNISAVMTPSGGSPTAMISLNNNGLVHIDMVPKSSKASAHDLKVLAHHKTAKPPKLAHHRPTHPKHRSV